MLSNNLKFLRKSKGLRQVDLAAIFGMKQSASISEYERGQTEPNVKALIAYSDYFKVSIDDILKKDLSIDVLNDCDESARYGNVVAKSKDKALAFCEKLIAQLERELERKDKEVGELKAELEKLKGK